METIRPTRSRPVGMFANANLKDGGGGGILLKILPGPHHKSESDDPPRTMTA